MPEDEYIEKTFIYKFPTCTTNQEYVLEVPLKIPYRGNVKELMHRIMSSFKLPCYVELDLLESLEHTIKTLTLEFYDEKAEKALENAKSGTLDIEDIIKNWEKIYKQKTVEYADPIGTTDEELFAVAYHRLVHSPSLEPILQAEHKHGREVTEVIQMRDSQYEQLTQKLVAILYYVVHIVLYVQNALYVLFFMFFCLHITLQNKDQIQILVSIYITHSSSCNINYHLH